MSLLSWAVETYEWLWQYRDKRVDDWFLMDSMVPTLLMTAAYLAIVHYGGKYMQEQQPYKLQEFMKVYNLFITLLSLWMFYEFALTSYMGGLNVWCASVDYSTEIWAVRLARVCWWYYFSKCIEFIDTFVFIMRKKFDQVTFLHVYHHSSMFPLWWMGVRWVPGGAAYFGAMLNSLVHVFMYFYYFLAAMGPAYKKYLWWKPYMTKMQLVQFYTVFIHTCITIYNVRQGLCYFPEWMGWGLLGYCISMITLFTAFYVHAYNKGQRAPVLPQVKHS